MWHACRCVQERIMIPRGQSMGPSLSFASGHILVEVDSSNVWHSGNQITRPLGIHSCPCRTCVNACTAVALRLSHNVSLDPQARSMTKSPHRHNKSTRLSLTVSMIELVTIDNSVAQQCSHFSAEEAAHNLPAQFSVSKPAQIPLWANLV